MEPTEDSQKEPLIRQTCRTIKTMSIDPVKVPVFSLLSDIPDYPRDLRFNVDVHMHIKAIQSTNNRVNIPI